MIEIDTNVVHPSPDFEDDNDNNISVELELELEFALASKFLYVSKEHLRKIPA